MNDSTDITAFGPARSTIRAKARKPGEINQLHAFWRACNYLALGMIYLRSNPLLREPLKPVVNADRGDTQIDRPQGSCRDHIV